MYKIIFSSLLIITSYLSVSQIYGDIAIDKRPVIQHIDYVIIGNFEGQIVFNIVVDESGKVTTCTVNKEKTNVNSTPSQIKAKNLIITQLLFKAGPEYPQFHRGEIVIKVKKQ